MFRFTQLNQKLRAVLVAALVVVAVVTANGIQTAFVALTQTSSEYSRDARQALLTADFEFALLRATAEAGSYAVTGHAECLQESEESIAAATVALDGLEKTLGPVPITDALESKHVGLLDRQRQLLQMAVRGLETARQRPADESNAWQLRHVFDQVNAHVAAADLLHRDGVAHREAELSFRALTQPSMSGFAVNFLVLLGLILGTTFLVRRTVIGPIDRLSAAAGAVAGGSLVENVTVTSGDEIGRLQVAFNRMVETLRERHTALEESEARFRQIAEHFPDAFVIRGAEAKQPIYVNPAFERVWGRSRSALLENPTAMVDAVHPQDRARVLAEWKRRDRGHPISLEFRVVDADDSVRWIWDRGIPVKNERGQLVRMIEVSEDITVRKTMDDAIHAKEQLYRTLVDTTATGYFVLDPAGVVMDANADYVRLSGHDEVADIQGRNWTEWTAPCDQDRLAAAMELCLADGGVRNLEINCVDSAGTVTPVEVNASLVQTNVGTHILGLCRDISRRKRVEKDMRESREEIRRFAATLIDSIEGERTRIAREMHDELGQVFTGLGLDLAWLSLEFSELPAPRRNARLLEKLRSMSEATGNGTCLVRRIANDLRPPLLDNLGIVPALQAHIEQFERRARIQCATELDSSIKLDPHQATMVFRVCQEAMTNIARHAQATQVTIRFAREHSNAFLLEVCDNGRGIVVGQERSPASLGMTGMRERARLLGGTLLLSNNCASGSSGTIVQLQFPWLQEEVA
jgi:PAS domain S-box-containing protein